MYNEYSTVRHATESLLRVAQAGIADIEPPQDNDLSIDSNTRYLNSVLGLMKAGRASAEAVGTIRSSLQAGYMFKKFRYGGDPRGRAKQAIDGFITRNLALANQTPNWLKVEIQKRMKIRLNSVLPCVDGWRPRFGKGSVAEQVPWISRWERIATHPELLSGGDLIPVSYGLSLHGGDSVRLCAVPKDYAKDRLITVEPWLNTWVQHATRQLIYESVHKGPLRGTAQDVLHVGKGEAEAIQRKLAVEGSKNGRYATLDLSDASDSISLEDVENTFPDWLIPWLLTCRTPEFQTSDGNSTHKLHMYAGMGNATTFAVETLYFWAAADAIASLSGHRSRFVSVYGDDIVCDSRTAALILETEGFKALGLKMNDAKSYWGDCPFRESCGVWAFQGHIVTPTRFVGFDLGMPSGRVGFADVIRRMTGSGCDLQYALADALVRGTSGCVPVSHFDAPGSAIVFDKHDSWASIHSKMETRLDKDLQVWQVRTKVPYMSKIRVPADRVGYLYGALLKCVTTNAVRVRGEIQEHVIDIPVLDGECEKRRWIPIEGIPYGAKQSIEEHDLFLSQYEAKATLHKHQALKDLRAARGHCLSLIASRVI